MRLTLKAMIGNKMGLVRMLKKSGVDCVSVHYIIHQEALCGKWEKMNDIMGGSGNVVNITRGGNKAN